MVGTEICRYIDTLIPQEEEIQIGLRKIHNEVVDLTAWRGMSALKIPAPKVETGDDFARTKLYWYANLNEWTKEDKIRTCYLATCMQMCCILENYRQLLPFLKE